MKHCRYCNKEISDSTPFCWYCGRELETRPERPAEESKQLSRPTLVVSVVFVLFILVSIGMLFFR
jgi:hypothetical protein